MQLLIDAGARIDEGLQRDQRPIDSALHSLYSIENTLARVNLEDGALGAELYKLCSRYKAELETVHILLQGTRMLRLGPVVLTGALRNVYQRYGLQQETTVQNALQIFRDKRLSVALESDMAIYRELRVR